MPTIDKGTTSFQEFLQTGQGIPRAGVIVGEQTYGGQGKSEYLGGLSPTTPAQDMQRQIFLEDYYGDLPNLQMPKANFNPLNPPLTEFEGNWLGDDDEYLNSLIENPYKNLKMGVGPFTSPEEEEAYRQNLIIRLGEMDLGLDAPESAYKEHAANIGDLSINVLEESIFNREKIPRAFNDPTGEYGFIIKDVPARDLMVPSKTYNLSKRDIAAINADLGVDSVFTNTYRLEEKQKEIFEQYSLINEYRSGMEDLGYGDNPAFLKMMKEQEKLLDELHTEYKVLYEKVTGEKHDE